jgi:hypothetical protein
VEVSAQLGGKIKAHNVRRIIRDGKIELPRHPKKPFLTIAPR